MHQDLDSLVKLEVQIMITTLPRVKSRVEVKKLQKVMSHQLIWKPTEPVSINLLIMLVIPVLMNGKSFQIFNQKISKPLEKSK
jgi:hypothetical protein